MKFVSDLPIGTSLGTMGGTFTRANRPPDSPPGPISTITPRLRLKFEMYGKGCPRSTARGVSTGKTLSIKYVLSSRLSLSDNPRYGVMIMPFEAMPGRTSSLRQRTCSSSIGRSFSLIALSCAAGSIPSGDSSLTPASICCFRPETRIMKNSSRLLENIDRKLSRSRSGCLRSRPSSSTRLLNSSQLSSLLNRS